MTSPIIGRRAVYTRTTHQLDGQRGQYVETGRELFRGTVVWIGAAGDYLRVVMLYDDGSLKSHAIENVTLEGESPEGALR